MRKTFLVIFAVWVILILIGALSQPDFPKSIILGLSGLLLCFVLLLPLGIKPKQPGKKLDFLFAFRYYGLCLVAVILLSLFAPQASRIYIFFYGSPANFFISIIASLLIVTGVSLSFKNKYQNDLELKRKWWHRLAMVLIYASAVVAFILLAGWTIQAQPWDQSSDYTYSNKFSFEQGYASVPGDPVSCSMQKVQITTGGLGSQVLGTGYVLWCGGDLTRAFAESAPNYFPNYFKATLPYETGNGIENSQLWNFRMPGSVGYFTDSNELEQLRQSGALNGLSFKSFRMHQVGAGTIWAMVGYILLTIFLPLIGFFLVRDIIYRSILYIVPYLADFKTVIKIVWNKMKANPKIVGGLGLILIAVLLFYWFQIRPESIRQECYRTAAAQWGSSPDSNTLGGYYQICMLSKGMGFVK
ncbi:MAG: hypothetical protein P4L74_02490 [Candidatus Doudnabacteria bacterium]|nr:hypothetical protein [Candidatus Doudnabacteria bacterium]